MGLLDSQVPQQLANLPRDHRGTLLIVGGQFACFPTFPFR